MWKWFSWSCQVSTWPQSKEGCVWKVWGLNCMQNEAYQVLRQPKYWIQWRVAGSLGWCPHVMYWYFLQACFLGQPQLPCPELRLHYLQSQVLKLLPLLISVPELPIVLSRRQHEGYANGLDLIFKSKLDYIRIKRLSLNISKWVIHLMKTAAK